MNSGETLRTIRKQDDPSHDHDASAWDRSVTMALVGTLLDLTDALSELVERQVAIDPISDAPGGNHTDSDRAMAGNIAQSPSSAMHSPLGDAA